jgi:hypothetical protein
MIAHLVAVALPTTPEEDAGVVGSQHPCADVRVVSPGGLKLVETRAVVEGGSDLWSRPPLGGEVESMEAMKRRGVCGWE